MVGSPGPASLLLLSVGANYSFRNSFSFLVGVVLSKQIIIWPLGLGIQYSFTISENVKSFFYFISVAYFLFLIYKFSFASFLNDKNNKIKPNFFYGLIIHPINPKAWLMVTASFSTFTISEYNILQNTIYVSIIFLLVQFFFHCIWCYGGSLINNFISNTRYERPFFIFLSLLTFLSLIFLLY